MSEHEDIFIGREKELQMIDEMVFDPSGANHILPVIADGGVGKTRLLKEVYERYKYKPGIVVLGVDYGNPSVQSLPGLSLHTVEAFGSYIPESHKIEYKKRLFNLQMFTTDPMKMQEEAEKVNGFLLELVQNVGQKCRILWLSDTVESVRPVEYGYHINLLGSFFNNTVMVEMGRPTESVLDLFARFSEIYRGWSVHDIYTLLPFSTEETLQYFHHSFPTYMPDELKEKVHILTGGNPILVAIACEWFTRHINLPTTIDISLPELRSLSESDLNKYRESFKISLIDKVRSLKEPIDWVILYLAYLDRRYDLKILQVISDTQEPEKLREIAKKLTEFVFVRKSMLSEGGVLHDEVQNLIRKYVWPVVDPSVSMRRSLANKIVQKYYLPEISRLNEKVQVAIKRAVDFGHGLNNVDIPPIPEEEFLRQALQIECLDYQLRISLELGLAYLDELLDEILKNRLFIQMDSIIHAIHHLAQKQQDQAVFHVRVAESLLAHRQTDQAVTLAQATLRQPDIKPAEAARALIILGQAALVSDEKIAHFTQAQEKAHFAGATYYEAIAHNNLGQTHQQQGHWRQAESAYRQALHLMDKDKEANQYANTLNNLAYVTMALGDVERADAWAERALRIRQETVNRRGLGFSYWTKGTITDAKGDPATALRAYRLSIEWFKSVEDQENVIRVQIDLAAWERRNQNFVQARDLLQTALESLDAATRARALHEAARIELDEDEILKRREATPTELEAKYAQALAYARSAYALAQELGDRYLEVSVLFDLSLLNFLRTGQEDIEHQTLLGQLLAEYEFPVERARLAELQGNIAYSRGDAGTAFMHYLEACRGLAGCNPGRFRRVFERVRDQFFRAGADIQGRVCQMFDQELADIPPTAPLAALKALCVNELDEL